MVHNARYPVFILSIILLGSLLFIRLSYAAWSEPSVVPPGNNTNPPLDTSSTSQNKTGALTVGSTTNYTAVGMYAPIYYDANNTSYYLQPSNTGTSAVFAGSLGIGTTAPQAAVDIRSAANPNIGIQLITPEYGYTNDYMFGTGYNLYFNGTNWITNTDGAQSGGDGILANYGGYSYGLTFVTIPSAGGTAQTITPANIFNYARMEILANGNVGIGTTSPAYPLQVAGNCGSSNCRNFYVNYPGGGGLANTEFSALTYPSGDGYSAWTALYAKQGSASYAGLFNGNVSIMNGNVGIGTAYPKAKFSVAFNNDDELNVYSPGDNTLAIQTTLDGNGLGTYGGANNVLTLQPLVGYVGIGTTSPNAELTVNGSSRSISTNNWADMSGDSSGYGVFGGNMYTPGSGGSFAYSNSHGSIGAIGFATNFPSWNQASVISSDTTSATAAQTFSPFVIATFDYNGNVGIGTTSPNAPLDVMSTMGGGISIVENPTYNTGYSNGTMFWIRNSGTATNNNYIRLTAGWNGSSGTDFGYIGYDGGNSMYISSPGNITLTTSGISTVFAYHGGEGEAIQLNGSNGESVFLENINGTFRLVNSPWTEDIFHVDQNGNVSIPSSGSLNVGGIYYNQLGGQSVVYQDTTTSIAANSDYVATLSYTTTGKNGAEIDIMSPVGSGSGSMAKVNVMGSEYTSIRFPNGASSWTWINSNWGQTSSSYWISNFYTGSCIYAKWAQVVNGNTLEVDFGNTCSSAETLNVLIEGVLI